MRPFPTSWKLPAVVLALASMLGCQGLSTGKSSTQGQGTQDPLPGSLSAAPGSIGFGSVLAGTSPSLTDTLTNTGGSTVNITQATLTGAGFSYAGPSLPMALAPGQSTTFSVTFAPQTAGNFSGSVAITSDGSNPNLTVALSGSATVQATPGTLSVSPVNAGSVTVGTSGTQTGTLSASGASVSVSSVGVGGSNPSEFSISGLSYPVTVVPGQPVTFTVTFRPGATGTATASASFTSNAVNSPSAATLTGTGTAATGTLSVSPVNAGSVTVGTSGTQTGTLSASGANVSVSSVGVGGTNPSEFSISGLSFPVTVAPGQPVTFTVTFTPGATGTATASASFTSNAVNSPSAATLTGTGTAAPVHSVSLTWKASSTQGITSYNVYRAVLGTSNCGSYSSIGSTPGSSTAFTDSVVADGTTYCYATTAVDVNGESGFSNIIQAKIPAP